MLSARNTGDVWPRGYAGLLGFLRRVGSRVKRILFSRHYVIAARMAVRADERYIGAVGEKRELSVLQTIFFPRRKSFLSRLDENTRRDFAPTKGALGTLGIRTYVRTKGRRMLIHGSWQAYTKILLRIYLGESLFLTILKDNLQSLRGSEEGSVVKCFSVTRH